jgi:glutamyl-tRNA synthetase
MKKIRVRFAPSPTGPLHVGGIRTAIYNNIFAKKHKGKFILRIEDTDKDRFLSGTEKYIVEALEWCGLSIDESPLNGGKYGPYKQSNRKHLYDFYIQKLIEKGHAYYAFDPITTVEVKEIKNNFFSYNAKTRLQMNNSISRKNIKNLEFPSPYVIRFKIPKEKLISVYDEIRGEIKINTSLLDDKILVKSDGMATYHLANVVDDHLMKITHVLRGEEWISSMPLHILIYRAFEWKIPFFVHLPLILKTSGYGKLSKRDEDGHIFPIKWIDDKNLSTGYREKGYFPESIVNMLALLGWNPGKEKELFCIKKLEKKFSFKRVQKSGSIFNKKKASWFNKKYFQKKPIEHLMIIFRKEFNKHGIFINNKTLVKVIKRIKNRISFVQELWENSHYFFISPQTYDNKYITIEIFYLLNRIQKSLMKEKYFLSSNLRRRINFFIYDNQLISKQVFQTLRMAIIGTLKGGDIIFIMEIIGKKETIERIRKFY